MQTALLLRRKNLLNLKTIRTVVELLLAQLHILQIEIRNRHTTINNQNKNTQINCFTKEADRTMLNYKGYNASVKLDPISKVLIGKVIDVSDSLTFEGEDVEQLIDAFHNTVDSYLEFCEEIGKEPEKPFAGKILYRTDSETHRKIVVAAAREGVSINSLIDTIVKHAVESQPTNEDSPTLIGAC